MPSKPCAMPSDIPVPVGLALKALAPDRLNPESMLSMK
jgi:hypothetical protein